jgi:hypothetical protein
LFEDEKSNGVKNTMHQNDGEPAEEKKEDDDCRQQSPQHQKTMSQEEFAEAAVVAQSHSFMEVDANESSMSRQVTSKSKNNGSPARKKKKVKSTLFEEVIAQRVQSLPNLAKLKVESIPVEEPKSKKQRREVSQQEEDDEYLSDPPLSPKTEKKIVPKAQDDPKAADTTTPEGSPTPSTSSKVTPTDGEFPSPQPKSPIGDINSRGNRFRQGILDQQKQNNSTKEEEKKEEDSAMTPNTSNLRNTKPEQALKETLLEKEDTILSQFSSVADSLESFPESPVANKTAGKKRALGETNGGGEEEEGSDETQATTDAVAKKKSKITKQTTLSSWFVKK